ncbi:hypothetical protein ANANG_G00094090 [Anguilla anguilla]|uniref:Uncharacterized protein n=1 Tax=Anguilla anguilla TaxID=7936 RepID=A0A9D3S481_ANGAN|nr:hypothetical protein ANANG_G00094090 [Anguilla anguilla]
MQHPALSEPLLEVSVTDRTGVGWGGGIRDGWCPQTEQGGVTAPLRTNRGQARSPPRTSALKRHRIAHTSCTSPTASTAPYLWPGPLHPENERDRQVGVSAGSGLLERLQRAEYLGRLQRTTEQTLALHQALAELAVAPYLQDLSPADSQLLQSLMADSMDALEGGRTDKERVWNEMQKVGLLEELVYEQEESFLRDKAARGGQRKPKAARKPRGRKRIPPTHPPGRDDRAATEPLHPDQPSQDWSLLCRTAGFYMQACEFSFPMGCYQSVPEQHAPPESLQNASCWGHADTA